jgi:DNA-binding XRE family transcriptional regulator
MEFQWDGQHACFFPSSQMNPKGKEEFANLLVKWRLKHGWNREESAAKLGVPHRTLQEWEQGRRLPSKMAQRGVVSRMHELERGET